MKMQGSLAMLWKKCNFAVTKHKKKSYECNFDEQFVELPARAFLVGKQPTMVG
jgi:hypothetical protein